jgi:hypothetical protein
VLLSRTRARLAQLRQAFLAPYRKAVAIMADTQNTPEASIPIAARIAALDEKLAALQIQVSDGLVLTRQHIDELKAETEGIFWDIHEATKGPETPATTPADPTSAQHGF